MHFSDAFKMAIHAIRAHKLRSMLTLVGIVAGVASIIGVMTAIAVVQGTMEKEMSILGTTTFQAQKWPPGGFNNDVDWREIQRRKPITVAQADIVRERVTLADLVGAELWQFGARVSYRGESTESNMTICGGTPEYAPNNTHFVELGRNISNEDIRIGRKVVVIGHALAEELFPFIDPLDKEIKIDGRKFTVIGVFEKKNSSMGGSYDNYMLMPVSTFSRDWGTTTRDDEERSVNMTVNARSPAVVKDAIEETRAILRQARGVRPGEPDDFYIFTNDSQIEQFNKATAGVKVGAGVVGMVALIVAGIGIMNIMLVAVTERTREIGVRKALGAARRDILLQFLLEAVVLCNIGGVGGILVGFGLGNIVTLFTGFSVSVPWDWAIRGLVFCSIVGIGFGMWPAIRASRLAPVDALSYES